MEPEINHGDIIALKKIEDKSFLPLGEVYAIVTTNDMRTIKDWELGKLTIHIRSFHPINHQSIPHNNFLQE